MSKEDGTVLFTPERVLFLATKHTVIAMKKACIYTQGVAKKMVGGAGQGRRSKRGKKFHYASLPGQPPARDTGILMSSITYSVKQYANILVEGKVGSDIDKIKNRATTDVDYGLYLEKGTKKMSARPWLVPSLAKASPKITEIFQKECKKI